jgi:hypothetical protein
MKMISNTTKSGDQGLTELAHIAWQTKEVQAER